MKLKLRTESEVKAYYEGIINGVRMCETDEDFKQKILPIIKEMEILALDNLRRIKLEIDFESACMKKEIGEE
jgi:hypothetical protein